MLIASNFLLWVAVAVLAVAVLALARRQGRGNGPAAPPPVADRVPLLRTQTLTGAPLVIGPGHLGPRDTLLLFLGADGTRAAAAVPLARAMGAAGHVDLIFVVGGPDPRGLAMACRIVDWPVTASPELARLLAAGATPYGILVRPDGQIAGRGPVATREQLEWLIGTASGTADARAYLKSLGGKVPA